MFVILPAGGENFIPEKDDDESIFGSLWNLTKKAGITNHYNFYYPEMQSNIFSQENIYMSYLLCPHKISPRNKSFKILK